METPYDGIAEVAESGRRNANLYLANGYKLLAFGVTTQQRQGDHGPYMKRGFSYVLGRPTDVAHFDPPPWEPYHDPTALADPAPEEEASVGEPSPP